MGEHGWDLSLWVGRKGCMTQELLLYELLHCVVSQDSQHVASLRLEDRAGCSPNEERSSSDTPVRMHSGGSHTQLQS